MTYNVHELKELLIKKIKEDGSIGNIAIGEYSDHISMAYKYKDTQKNVIIGLKKCNFEIDNIQDLITEYLKEISEAANKTDKNFIEFDIILDIGKPVSYLNLI